jgi:hypothetical protein
LSRPKPTRAVELTKEEEEEEGGGGGGKEECNDYTKYVTIPCIVMTW